MSGATCNSSDVNCSQVRELTETLEKSLSVSKASQNGVHDAEKKDSTSNRGQSGTTDSGTSGVRELPVECSSEMHRKRFSKEGHARCMAFDAANVQTVGLDNSYTPIFFF